MERLRRILIRQLLACGTSSGLSSGTVEPSNEAVVSIRRCTEVQPHGPTTDITIDLTLPVGT
jgi:hypothetical protein